MQNGIRRVNKRFEHGICLAQQLDPFANRRSKALLASCAQEKRACTDCLGLCLEDQP